MAKLRYKAGPAGQKDFDLKPGVNTLGRNPDNQLVADDPSISGFHCEIKVDGSSISVRDLGSTNGTFINGTQVQEAALVAGQTIQFGGLEWTFEDTPPTVPGQIKLSIGRSSAVPTSPAITPTAVAGPVAAPATFKLASHRVADPGMPPPLLGDHPAPPEKPCKVHESTGAEYVCKQCRSMFCAECVPARKTGKKEWRRCLGCGGQCISLSDHEAVVQAALAKEQRSFIQMLFGAFGYPFGKGGILMLMVGTIFFVVLNFLALFSLTMAVLASGYLVALLQKILVSTAQGDESLPGWPDVSEWWDDIVRPLLLVIFTMGVCFGPAIAYLIWATASGEGLGMFVATPLLGLGFLCFPMAVLAVAMTDSFTAVNPLVIIPSMIKIPLQYFLVCVAFFSVLALSVLIEAGLKLFIPIPILPTTIAEFFSLYFLAVVMRMLGLLYYKYRKQLAWFS